MSVAAYTCPVCHSFVIHGEFHYCCGEQIQTFPNPPAFSQVVVPQFVCPRCKGGFSMWGGEKKAECPWCGLESGTAEAKE